MKTNLAVNSSKLSSWCSSERRAELVLKLLAAITPGTMKDALEARGIALRMASERKKVEGALAAMRSTETEAIEMVFAIQWVRELERKRLVDARSDDVFGTL